MNGSSNLLQVHSCQGRRQLERYADEHQQVQNRLAAVPRRWFLPPSALWAGPGHKIHKEESRCGRCNGIDPDTSMSAAAIQIFSLFKKKTPKKTLFDAAHSSAVLCRRLVKRRKRKKIKRGDVLTSARCGVRSNQATGGSGVGRNRFNPHDDVDGPAGWSASAHQTSSFY